MILVTGGTGLVGSHLLYFLLKDGATVRAIHRTSSDLEAVKKIFFYYSENAEALFKKIDWVEANITDIPALSEAFKGITHVYHAAAYISFDPKNYYKLKKSNIEGTANIVNLCLANKIQKLCYVSSVATLGETLNGALIDEKTQWNPEEKNSVYAITKFGAEMEVWRGAQEGLDVVIVNPGVILGEGFWDSGSGSIFKQAAKGIPFYFGGGIGVVDVKDVVNIMLQLMKSDIVHNNYILVSENVSYKKFLSEIATSLGKKPPTKEAPKWILNVVRFFDWLAAILFGTKRKLLKSTVKSMYTTSFYDASKIREEVDYTFLPFEETVSRVATIYSSEASSS
ncbi:NAD-dependent epimerase/dehydratase family protein [Jejudonia soesokkakensis]|uniref:NAD-dependent epimerase/dehydratase family protein n=1 Tax=Jejudonia soesokkakensis TaxID=1323432 RepID=A0ABW2MSA1_9FLAO